MHQKEGLCCVRTLWNSRADVVLPDRSMCQVVQSLQERDATAQELEELITQMESLIQSKEAAEQQVIFPSATLISFCCHSQ